MSAFARGPCQHRRMVLDGETSYELVSKFFSRVVYRVIWHLFIKGPLGFDSSSCFGYPDIVGCFALKNSLPPAKHWALLREMALSHIARSRQAQLGKTDTLPANLCAVGWQHRSELCCLRAFPQNPTCGEHLHRYS